MWAFLFLYVTVLDVSRLTFNNVVPVVCWRAAEVPSGGLYLRRFLVSFAAQRDSTPKPSLCSASPISPFNPRGP